jgi:hypothetical protein
MENKNIITSPVELPLEIGGSYNIEKLVKIDRIFQTYGYDYDLLLKNNIITKNYFIESVTGGISIFFPKKKYIDYDVLPVNQKTEFFSLYKTEMYRIVDKTKTWRDIRKLSIYKEWRKSVLERENYTCQNCGKRSKHLHAHHKVQLKNNQDLAFDVNNGIALCNSCHTKIHQWARWNKDGKK